MQTIKVLGEISTSTAIDSRDVWQNTIFEVKLSEIAMMTPPPLDPLSLR